MNTPAELLPVDANRPLSNGAFPEYDGLTGDELRGELARLAGATVDSIVRMADVVRRLDVMGGEVSDLLGDSVVNDLRLIADGALHPEVYLRFGGRRPLLKRIKALPKREQERIASGESIPVAIIGRDGKRDYRQVRAEELGPAQIDLVFADNRIRSLPEQYGLLEAKPVQSIAAKAVKKKAYKIDHRMRVMVVREPNTVFTLADLEDIVAALRG